MVVFMYKVILVDDEYWALKANSKIFDWQAYGFAIVGETTDSEEAIEMILKEKPDVVFVDINMPYISGFDLIKAVSKRINCKFIIVTAYSDFNYAKQAIQCGVFEYCVKPIRKDDAQRILNRLKVELDKENGIINIDEFLEKYNYTKVVIDNYKFKKMLSYIFQNINTKMNLKELSDKFSLNSNYCSTLFGKYFNCGFSDYVAGIRMANAAKMLAESDLSIKKIAQLNGYDDYFYFNKVFKRIIGVTPNEYRKKSIRSENN